jgi:hypothetical protein
MKITRIGAFYGVVAVDAVVFMVGSFAANLLTGPLRSSWPMYIFIAFLAAVTYGCIRWLLIKPERVRLLASRRLADSLGDSAEMYGIDALYNMQQGRDQDRRNSDTQMSINQAQSMRLAANSGASYLSVGLNRHWPNVRQRLNERVPFKIILLDLFSAERGARNQINVEGEADDAKVPLGDIIRASNQYPDLEVRFTQTGMTCTVFITNDEAYFDPYHLAPDGGRITNRFLCLRMRKMQPAQGLANYEILSRHFETLWRTSTPLQDWLREHDGDLPPLPALTANHVGAIMR